MSTEATTIRWEQDDTGIVTLVLDDPTQSANTMNAAFRASLAAIADRLEAEKDGIRGVVLTSAKKTFFAGGDLRDLIRVTPADAQAVFENSMAIKRNLRRIETLGKPVVAALNGAALGGGYEIALACHHRVALDAPGSRIGCPEVTLGLLPGGGGVVRTVRMLGIADALLKVLLQGTQYTPRRAAEHGLVDEVADSPEDMLARARAFIDAHPESAQPWDEPGHRIPGGTPANPKFAANLPAFPANLRKQTGGAPYPAPRNIMAAAVEGSQVDFETAQVIEARYFVDLAVGQTAKNMIQAFFFDLQAVNSGANRPKGVGRREVRKVAVLGAGMMGAGIAYSCARAGIEVILKDVSLEAAVKGKGYSEKLCAKAVSRGRTTQDKADALLARITPTAEAADLAGCDAVIEAVFEDTSLKHKVFQEVQQVVAPDALLCSNTSTLPITALAEGVERQSDFIGLHFFSPVDKMPLVEIIKGSGPGRRHWPAPSTSSGRSTRRPSSSTTRAASSPRASSGTSSTRAWRWSARASSRPPSSRPRRRPATRRRRSPSWTSSRSPSRARSAPRRGARWRRRAAPGPRTPPRPSSTAWSTSSGGPGAAAARASTSTARTAAGAPCGPGCASTSPSPGTRSRSATCRNACCSRRRWTPCGCWTRGC